MAQTVCVIVSAEDRARLAAIIGDRSRPLKHMQRARIVLQSADRLSALEISRRAGVSRPAVWRWQRHYAEKGVERLLHEGSRKPGKAPVAVATVAKVLALTNADPPDETTHWTGRAMAKAVNLSLRTVQRIWAAHKLQPHRWRTFKRSKDPAFAEKVEDIVGLYMHPPAHAVVLSIDEKSQIQALDRTQPGLPTITNATAPPPCLPPSTSWRAWCSAAACKGTPIRS
jgi:transposase